MGRRIATTQTQARHPAFDVIPARYIAGIITERGIIRPPYVKNIKKMIC